MKGSSSFMLAIHYYIRYLICCRRTIYHSFFRIHIMMMLAKPGKLGCLIHGFCTLVNSYHPCNGSTFVEVLLCRGAINLVLLLLVQTFTHTIFSLHCRYQYKYKQLYGKYYFDTPLACHAHPLNAPSFGHGL